MFNSPPLTVANTLVAQNGTADCLGPMTAVYPSAAAVLNTAEEFNAK